MVHKRRSVTAKGTRVFRIIICVFLGLAIRAESGSDRAGIVCYGAFLNYGAEIESEIMCIDGLQNMNAD